MSTRPPIVAAVLRGHSIVVLACPYCGERHFHGADGGEGHRAAHCHLPGVDSGAGYTLKLISLADVVSERQLNGGSV